MVNRASVEEMGMENQPGSQDCKIYKDGIYDCDTGQATLQERCNACVNTQVHCYSRHESTNAVVKACLDRRGIRVHTYSFRLKVFDRQFEFNWPTPKLI